MKKICLFVGYYPINRGGAEYQVYLLAQKLREQCEIFYISAGQDREECFVDDGLRVYTLKSPRLLCFKNIWFLLKPKVVQILKAERPDVIYQMVAFSGTGIAAQYCTGRRCKFVWHIASERDVVPQPKRRVDWNILNRIEGRYRDYGIRNAHVIIGQAAYQDELLHQHYGRSCDLIVGNWLPAPAEEFAKDNPVKVVWVANVKPLKQPEVFIRLASMLKHRREVRFIMIGRPASGRYQKGLEEAMKGLPNLVYLGEKSLDEVNQVLAEAHVLVNTSQYEGFPNTFVQAWLRQVPVISLNVDPDNVLKTRGLGFHSRSLEGMARDTERLMDHSDLRESIGRRARTYALQYHAMEPNIAKTISFLLNGHKACVSSTAEQNC